MVTIPKEFYYLGIDETSLNIGRGSSLVVVAETKNGNLTHDVGYRLDKAKDILQKARKEKKTPQFPKLEELLCSGLTQFHWMRCKGGRFSRQELQHAIIAHMIQINGYKPQNTLVQIDAFYGAQDDKSKFLIREYLLQKGFNLPLKNIEIIGQGDKKIPIINYADILAFQIGASLGENNDKRTTYDTGVRISGKEEIFDEQRVMTPLNEHARDKFEDIMRWYERR